MGGGRIVMRPYDLCFVDNHPHLLPKGGTPMTAFCQTLFTMTAAAAVAALAVILLRPLLKNAPRWVVCLLWLVVLFRMVCPVTFEAPVSLVPDQITSGQVTQQVMPAPAVTTTDPVIPQTTPAPTQTDTPVQTQTRDPYQLLFLVWAAGAGSMALWAVGSYGRLRFRVADAVRVRDNIFETDRVDTPFVCGFLKPRIFLPVGLDPQLVPHVVRHEEAHIRRLDHLTKPLFWLALCLHWFNPVLWLAYILFCRDLETACDQRVIRDLDRQDTANYAAALLCLGRDRSLPQAVPLAFGEENAKGRVKGVLNYKKPKFWAVLLAVVLCVGAGFLLLSDGQQQGDTLEGVPITEVSYEHKEVLGPAGEDLTQVLFIHADLPQDLRTRLVAMLEKYGHEEYTLPIIIQAHKMEMEDPPESVPIASQMYSLSLTSSEQETQFSFSLQDNGDGYLERFVYAEDDESSGTRTEQQAAYVPGLAEKRDFQKWQADLETYLQTRTLEGHQITQGCLHESLYCSPPPDGGLAWGYVHVLDFPEDLRQELVVILNQQEHQDYVWTQPGDLDIVPILERLSDITFAPDEQGWNYALMLLEDGTYFLERSIPDDDLTIYTQAARYPDLADSPDFQQWLEKLQEYLYVKLPDQIYEMRVDTPQQARSAMAPFAISGIVGDYTLDYEGNRLIVQVETPTRLYTIEDQRKQYLGWASLRMIDLIGGINTVAWVYPPTEELPEGCSWEINNYQKAQSAQEFRSGYNSPREMSP